MTVIHYKSNKGNLCLCQTFGYSLITTTKWEEVNCEKCLIHKKVKYTKIKYYKCAKCGFKSKKINWRTPPTMNYILKNVILLNNKPKTICIKCIRELN